MESTILATLEQSATSGEASLSRLLGGGRLNACGGNGSSRIQDPGWRRWERRCGRRKRRNRRTRWRCGRVCICTLCRAYQGALMPQQLLAVDACADGAHEVGTLSMWDVLVEKELRMAKLGSAGLYCDYSLEVGTECKVQRLCKWIQGSQRAKLGGTIFYRVSC